MKLLALLGVITILAGVAVEAFAQSTVGYYSCPQLIDGSPASIPKAHTFSPSIDTLRSGTKRADMETKLAIYKGLVSPPQNSSANMASYISCPTGNCTFTTDSSRGGFATLGVCHACRDITSECQTEVVSGKRGSLTYSLPSGATSKIFQAVRSMVQVLHMVAVDRPQPAYINDYPMFTVETIVIKSRNCTEVEKESPPCQVGRGIFWEPAASSCSLYPCVKAYNADVVAGIYTEKEVWSRNLENTFAPASQNRPNYWLTTEQAIRNGSWSSCGETSEMTTENTIQVFKLNKTACEMSFSGGCGDAETLWYPPDCVWSFPRWEIAAVVADSLAEKIGNHTLLDLKRDVAFDGEPYIQRLYQAGGTHIDNVKEFMDGIANALTERIRTKSSDPPNLQTVFGETWQTETCIRVRLEWMTYLGALLFLEILFLVFVISCARREGCFMDWKSSSLPTFFYPIHRRSVKDTLVQKKHLEKEARDARVRLAENGGVWKFYKVK